MNLKKYELGFQASASLPGEKILQQNDKMKDCDIWLWEWGRQTRERVQHIATLHCAVKQGERQFDQLKKLETLI